MANFECNLTSFWRKRIMTRHWIGEALVTFTLGAEVHSIALPRDYSNSRTLPVGIYQLQAAPRTFQRMDRIVGRVWRSTHASSSTSSLICPVCRCTPEEPFQTVCGHAYCEECFINQCTKDTQEFPIRCLHGLGESTACNKPLRPYDLERALPPHTLENIFEASFRQYVRSHPAKYRYCPTPTCCRLNSIESSLLATGASGTTVTCDGCSASFCLLCNAPAHPDRTCEQAGSNDGLDGWKRENDAKDCPKCGTTTAKDYGCNHMQCPACMVHFCWFCLAFFDTGLKTYEHMNAVHNGDWGIEEFWPRRDLLTFIAGRLGIDQAVYRANFAWAVQNQVEANEDDHVELQGPVNHNGDDAQLRGMAPHQWFAFDHDLQELRRFAEANFDDPREAFIGFIRDIVDFVERHPEVAIRGYLEDVNHLDEIETFLEQNHVPDVGARLRVALDGLYRYGLFDALFDQAVERQRQILVLQAAIRR